MEKNDIHFIESNLRHCRRIQWIIRTSRSQTRLGTCGRIGFKLYKSQTKSENHEICHDIIRGGFG